MTAKTANVIPVTLMIMTAHFPESAFFPYTPNKTNDTPLRHQEFSKFKTLDGRPVMGKRDA